MEAIQAGHFYPLSAAGVLVETCRRRSICLEIRAAGHGDGFRSGGGGQVLKARITARTAQTTIY